MISVIDQMAWRKRKARISIPCRIECLQQELHAKRMKNVIIEEEFYVFAVRDLHQSTHVALRPGIRVTAILNKPDIFITYYLDRIGRTVVGHKNFSIDKALGQRTSKA
uniref:Uncharacterized protein n=1 Tax=Rhizobium leguminosarum TaxID=384 RepID=A0A179BY41_RHILE|nr:hypothetical protein A4U53_38480 [Rhizobium leguminosarum]